MESVNSTTYIKRPPYMTETQEKFLYTRELLTGRIFLGSYQERKYVPVLQEYRDVVVISSEETELQSDLEKLIKKWLGVSEVKWVGITGPCLAECSNSYRFWVKFENLPFGHYWFQIKRVKEANGEIILHLKHIRKSLAPPTAEKSSKRGEESSLTTMAKDLDLSNVLAFVKTTFTDSIQPQLKWENLWTAIKILVALTIVFVTGIIAGIAHLGDFTLKLVRELSILVREFTPIAIQVIDFLTKLTGGFYILIARILFGNRNQPVERYTYSIPYSSVSSTSPPPSSHQSNVNWRKRNEKLRNEFLSFR